MALFYLHSIGKKNDSRLFEPTISVGRQGLEP